jgi:hypothetical protein
LKIRKMAVLALVVVCALLGSLHAAPDGRGYVFALIHQAGFGNQYKDIVGAIALAAAWNRTFVLVPFYANKVDPEKG